MEIVELSVLEMNSLDQTVLFKFFFYFIFEVCLLMQFLAMYRLQNDNV